MTVLLFSISICIGIVLLYLGAKCLVIGSTHIAHIWNITPFITGVTFIAIATGSPELIVSLLAALQNANSLSLGNIIGSNIINTLLILGISLLIKPLRRDPHLLKIELPIMSAASLILTLFTFYGSIPRWGGGCMLLVLCLTMFFQVRARHLKKSIDQREQKIKPLHVFLLVLGTSLLVFGGKFFIHGSLALAGHFALSESFIAVTIVALGTSLPELATCLYASIKDHSDMTLGNIIGSNLFNILGVIGLCALIHPLHLPPQALHYDVIIMLSSSFVLYGLVLIKKQLSWRSGIFLLIFYTVYSISIL